MKTLGLVIAMVALLMLAGPMGLPSSSEAAPAPSDKFMGGTIRHLDPAGLKVILQTDTHVGETEALSVVLTVVSADVLQGLRTGDHVHLELNDQGKVQKMVKTAPAFKEAPEPRG